MQRFRAQASAQTSSRRLANANHSLQQILKSQCPVLSHVKALQRVLFENLRRISPLSSASSVLRVGAQRTVISSTSRIPSAALPAPASPKHTSGVCVYIHSYMYKIYIYIRTYTLSYASLSLSHMPHPGTGQYEHVEEAKRKSRAPARQLRRRGPRPQARERLPATNATIFQKSVP